MAKLFTSTVVGSGRFLRSVTPQIAADDITGTITQITNSPTQTMSGSVVTTSVSGTISQIVNSPTQALTGIALAAVVLPRLSISNKFRTLNLANK